MGSRKRPGKFPVRRVVSKFEEVLCESPPFELYGKPSRGPAMVAAAVAPLLSQESVEVFAVLLLDAKNRVVGFAEVSRGTLKNTLVHPREVFGPALRLGCAAVIAVHNHPSGDPEPSHEDLEVTKRLSEAGRLLGVPLLDHVILGDEGRFASLRERFEF